MKDRKVEMTLSIASLFKILAIVASVSGLLYTIIFIASGEGMDAALRTAYFFYGLMLTALSGGVLYGLACIISQITGNSRGQTSSDESEQPE